MPIENHVSSDLFSPFIEVTHPLSKWSIEKLKHVDDNVYHYRIVKRSRTREGFTVERIAASPVSCARMRTVFILRVFWLHLSIYTKCAYPSWHTLHSLIAKTDNGKYEKRNKNQFNEEFLTQSTF